MTSPTPFQPLSRMQTALLRIGGVLVLVGAVLPLLPGAEQFAPYVFTLGALLFGGMQAAARYVGTDITIRRLRRQQLLGAAALVAAGVLMFTSLYRVGPFQGAEWQLMMAIGAVMQVYTALRLPAALRRSQEERKP